MLSLGFDDFHHDSFDAEYLASLDNKTDALEDTFDFVDRLQRAVQNEIKVGHTRLLTTTERLKQGLTKQGIKKQLEEQVATLKERLDTQPAVAFLDKLCFFVSVYVLCFLVWVTATHPEQLPFYYFWAFLGLLIVRVWSYRRKGWGYLTLDLCYFVNLYLILMLFVFKCGPGYFYGVFALAHGPVLWAIVQWRNSLVFHSLDKITSCFIHISPCTILYSLKWLIKDQELLREKYPALLEEPPSLANMAKWAAFLYGIWQLTYYALVNVVNREKILAGQRVTAFTYLSELADIEKGLFHRGLNLCGPSRKQLMFTILQLGYSVVTIIPAIPCWKSEQSNRLLILGVMTVAVWNGANFYIEVFGKSYAQYYRDIHMDFADAYVGVAEAPCSEPPSPMSRGFMKEDSPSMSKRS